MAIPVGINRGYLFGIGKAPYKDHAYVVPSVSYPFDPFANPKLLKAFDAADVIVSNFQKIDDSQELTDFIQALPDRLQEILTPKELKEIKASLLPLLDQIPHLNTFQGSGTLRAFLSGDQNDALSVAALVLLGIKNILKLQAGKFEELSPQKDASNGTMVEALKSRAKLLSKPVVPLSSEEVPSPLGAIFSLLREEPELLRALLFALTQKEVAVLLSGVHAYEQGSYDDMTPDMTRIKLIKSILSSANIDVKKIEDSLVLIQIDALLSQQSSSEKIEELVKKDSQRHLFLISPETLSEWPRFKFSITQIKIPLKPVGFFWKIQDDAGHESVLMGSMHITVEKLVNFPKAILDLFDRSDALAVEIDVTREDVIARRDAVSWEKRQAKELQLLSSVEKEQLFTFLKALYSDLKVTATDDFDEQTWVIIQALRKFASDRFQNAFAQVDKTTNESFSGIGIDKALMRRAKEKQIPIMDLETFDDHFIELGSGKASYLTILKHEDLKQLTETFSKPLEEFVEDCAGSSGVPTRDEIWEGCQKPVLQKWTDLMEAGDLDALEAEYLAEGELKRQKVVQRNQNMASKIDEFMKSGKRHFCVAGAMHMAGPSSILSFLKQYGYKVERVIVEEPLDSWQDDAIEWSPPKPSYSFWGSISSFVPTHIGSVLSWSWRKVTGAS